MKMCRTTFTMEPMVAFSKKLLIMIMIKKKSQDNIEGYLAKFEKRILLSQQEESLHP